MSKRNISNVDLLENDADIFDRRAVRVIGIVIFVVVLIGALLVYKYVYLPKKQKEVPITYTFAYEIGEKAKMKDTNVIVISRRAIMPNDELHEVYEVMIENSNIVVRNLDEKQLSKWK